MKATLIAAALAIALGLIMTNEVSASTIVLDISGSGFTGVVDVTPSNTTESNPYPCISYNSGLGNLVTGIAGTLNGSAITALYGVGDYQGNDNLIYTSGPLLDWAGIAFFAGGVGYNIFQGNYDGHAGYYLCDTPNGLCNYNNPISIKASVPEPATWALMLIGLGGLGAALRSRPRGATAQA